MVTETSTPSRKRRLTRDDWIEAAVVALLSEGFGAVAVEPLADKLGATKGSFYWHMSSRGELLGEALARWESRFTERFIEDAELAGGTPEERLSRLLTSVIASGSVRSGETVLHSTAVVDPLVAPAIRRVGRRRIEYVAGLLSEIGVPDPLGLARIAYATILGLQQLAVFDPVTFAPESEAKHLMRLLLGHATTT